MLRALQSLKRASHLPSISTMRPRHGNTSSIFPSPGLPLPTKEWCLRQAVSRMSSAALVSRENPKAEIEKDDGNRIEHAVGTFAPSFAERLQCLCLLGHLYI
jgi:hypothetical protein